MESKSSYMLIFRDPSPESYESLGMEGRRRLLQQWNSWCDDVAAQGKMRHGHPLESELRIVTGVRGERVVDGPFAESKEAIGGYFLLQDSSLQEATEIAQRCPNLPYGMTIEIRAVAECCHLARSLGQRSMREPADMALQG